MLKLIRYLIFITMLSTLLIACGGGGGTTPPPTDTTPSSTDPVQPPTDPAKPLAAAIPDLSFAQSKVFRFNWTDAADTTFYRLLENPDGTTGFTQVGSDIPQGTQTFEHIVPLYARVNAQYILQSCNDVGCTDSAALTMNAPLAAAIGYFKASNTEADDRFGRSLSLSADGNTLAVGAPQEDSNASGIGNNQMSNSAFNSGAVYIFTRSGGTWVQQAYVKASNAKADPFGTGDSFGSALSLSTDGNTLAVGASGENSNATGIGNIQTNDSARDSGAVYVFTRNGDSWTQQAYVKASNTEVRDFFGTALSLSADGNTLAVAAVGEDSNATGINNGQTDNSVRDSGAVYVFTRSGGIWTQQAYVKASNTGFNDNFGSTMSLSADGNTLAVGATAESSNATGINNSQFIDSATNSGAVYVFTRSGGTWSQQAYVKSSNSEGGTGPGGNSGDRFGSAVSLSADGNTLAVGAAEEDSNATGIGNDQANNFSFASGAVYVFTRSGGSWTQQAYVKASNNGGGDGFGIALNLSADGNTLAVGATLEDSNATGIIGSSQTGNSARDSGAVYVFTHSSGIWTQQAYVKASNTGVRDEFSRSLSLSANGDTLAIGAYLESSNATDIGNSQTDNSASLSGAVYLY